MQTTTRQRPWPFHRISPRRSVLLAAFGLFVGGLSLFGTSGCYLTEPIESHVKETPCADCHQGDYDGTTSPKHSVLNYPSTCNFCHTKTSWRPATFDVDHDRHFPLVGAHKMAECVKCHVNDKFKGLPKTCIGCHQTDYDNTKEPVHADVGYSTDCTQCHGQDAWKPANLEHDKVFPLVGIHRKIACTKCHVNDVFKGTSRTCIGCHKADYDGTKNPDHTAAKYPTTCTDCHSQDAWKPASLDHEKFFPLVGAHKTAACSKCHVNNVYKGTSKTCIGCHDSDYKGVKNPDHAAANYSQVCTQCHTQDAWKPSTFDHNKFFPIRGGHASFANDCKSCHLDNTDYKKFECIKCHEHDKARTDDHHKEVSGYNYASADCFKCHSNGRD